MDAEMASKAARRLGDPRVPTRASTPAAAAQATMVAVQAREFASAWPPWGSAVTMNTDTAAHVTMAAIQA
jgi:hypothetical protein